MTTAMRAAGALAALALLAVGAGAESGDSGSASSNGTADAVRERAEAYWQARLSRSQEVYDFYVPEEKGGPKRNKIRDLGNVYYESFEVGEVDFREQDRAAVTMRVKISSLGVQVPPEVMNAIREEPRVFREPWKKVEGTWYREFVPFDLSRRLGSPVVQKGSSEASGDEGAAAEESEGSESPE